MPAPRRRNRRNELSLPRSAVIESVPTTEHDPITGNLWDNIHLDIEPDESFRVPSPEAKAKMTERFSILSDLMADADFYWQVDGGANISLYNIQAGGDWLRRHKDIDLTVFGDEMTKVYDFFSRKGFRFFDIEWPKQPGEGIPKRVPVGVDEAISGSLRERSIVLFQVDESGEPLQDGALDGIDLHVQNRLPDGTVRNFGGDIPAHFFNGREMKLGEKFLRLSHPALVALHKLNIIYFEHRPYDEIDLKYLARFLTREEVDALERVLHSREITVALAYDALEILFSLPPDASDDDMRTKLVKLDRLKTFSDHPTLKGFIANIRSQRAHTRTQQEIADDLKNRFYSYQHALLATLGKLRGWVEKKT